MNDHTHKKLMTERIVMTIPGDVAIALLNSIGFVQRHHFDQDRVYCKGDKEMIDNLDEFKEDLKDKIEHKKLWDIAID